MNISIGPTGALIQGDVLDVNKEQLERTLQAYDAQLYLRWNPKKRLKMGCWELRRRPEMKTSVYKGSVDGVAIYNLEYTENGENHIKDFDVLGYQIASFVKKFDIWAEAGYQKGRMDQVHQWMKDFERAEDARKDELKAKQAAEARYALGQERSVIRDYREAILSGTNPAQIAAHWGQSRR